MSGFIGLVELGSMTGSQFAAGRSYHDTATSPCMAGMINGASFADLDAVAVAASIGASDLGMELGASWMIVVSF